MSETITTDSIPVDCPDCDEGKLEYRSDGVTPIDGETATGRVKCDSCSFTGTEVWDFVELRRD